MAHKDILKWGFKASAERTAIEYRKKLSIEPWEPLCAIKLAEHLEVTIYAATEFLSRSDEIRRLSGIDEDCGWSAMTIVTKAGNQIIINNPYNTPARQQSDIMHELAHIICNHKQSFSDYDFEIPLGMRHFDEMQEEEAKCLGSTLQITRPGLLWALKRKYSISEIADHFNSSVEMATYRIRMSGADKQHSYRAKISA